MNMDNSEDEIKKYFEMKVKQSGYSLESEVENKLKPTYGIQRDVAYLDKDENKGRSIDFVASAFIPHLSDFKQREKIAVANLLLVIECKNLPDHGWIFFPGEDRGFTIAERVSAMRPSEPDPAMKFVPVDTFPDLYYASTYDEHALDTGRSNAPGNIPTRKSNNREDNLYSAIHAVTKATRDQIEQTEKLMKTLFRFYNNMSKVPAVTLFQPVIIFNGRMYSSEVKNGQPSLQQIDYAQIQKNYRSQNYNEILGTIHIVNYNSLDRYIQLVNNYYWSYSGYILNNQDHLLKLVKDNLVNWSNYNPLR